MNVHIAYESTIVPIPVNKRRHAEAKQQQQKMASNTVDGRTTIRRAGEKDATKEAARFAAGGTAGSTPTMDKRRAQLQRQVLHRVF